MDGLGYRTMCAGNAPPSVDKDGREVIIFTIKPDDVVRKRYQWRSGKEIDELGNKKIIIAKIDLIPLNIYDDSNRMWLYVKSFNHDATELSERYKILNMEIERYRKENMQLEAENIKLSEDNLLLRTNPEKALAASSEVFQKVAQGLSSLNIGKKEEK